MSLVRPSFILILSSLLVAAATCHMAQANPATPSQWLEKVVPHRYPRELGCWRRPWVCQEEGGRSLFLPFVRKMCCNNRCVDVTNDANNCGACGVRCPFSLTCCNGVCVDPKTNPFHCGVCNNQCAFSSLCSHGMCGYAQEQQPFPPRHHPFPQPGKHSPPLPPSQKYPSRP
ncbi:hypothetical protein Taro_051754 [Colocasia esculenta]|uniref:Uncharacterized protein n=1 Tax=Colocasia esculenta TaxID=4460 RepID=A0A843XHT7_COLES|nr:hypothetical protein [Colocasia esculenta]